MAVDNRFPLRRALDAAEPKPEPTGPRDEKKNYAESLSRELAQTLADALRRKFPNITPTADGKHQEAAVGAAKGRKRLDVGVMDSALGLVLGISVKTYSFEDYSPSKGKLLGRWTKNALRNDHELGAEATALHRRQPYAVLAAIMFQPLEICDGAASGKQSSFAHHVDTLVKRTGRGRRPIRGVGARAYVDYGGEDTRLELFERVWIGLYESTGPKRGAVRFFDVEQDAPRLGRPDDALTIDLATLVKTITADVDRRNRKAPDLGAETQDVIDGDDA